MVCHHPVKSGDHRHCDGGDMILICCMASPDHMFKVLCKFMGDASHLVRFGGHCSWASGDTKYSICCVASQKHLIEGSFNFIKLCHHLTNFGGYRYCGRLDIIFEIK